MRRALVAVGLLAGACGGGDDDPAGVAALEVPAIVALPYVAAGAGPSQLDVIVANPGGAAAGALVWRIDGDPDLAVVAAPDAIAAGGSATLTVRWAGAAAPRIAGATLIVDGDAGERRVEVWAVAGDPALAAATFAPLVGPGGVAIGQSAVVAMPTAPYPAPGRPWTDARVHLFVPDGYRQRDAHDVVLHFHGHGTTIDATVPAHRYREQLHASGVDAILIVPQGPVEAASGDFGKLSDPAGTAAFLDEVVTVLYRAGVITRPVLGEVTLTSHSGGYGAVARNLAADAAFVVGRVHLFDSLYGFETTFRDFARGGGRLRSSYTASGGTAASNMMLATTLGAATEPTARALRDAPSVIYASAASHDGCTRDDGAFGEQLRWGGRRSRRGPRAELLTATAAGGDATITWLAPLDDDLTGWSIERSSGDGTWTAVATADAAATQASFPLDGGAHVRIVPIVDGVAVADRQPSDVYRVDPAAEVLIVDGFDRVVDGSWRRLAHDFAARIGDAAGAVHAVSNEAVAGGFELSRYRAVIWLVGDESTDDHAFTAGEQAAIEAYLTAGGRIVISGSEIGYELGATASGRGWLARVAGAVFAADDAGANGARGAGPLAALPAFAFGGAAAPYVEDFADTFTAAAGAVVALAYATSAGAAVGIPGRAIVVGFPLEVIEDPAARAAVVDALLDFVGR